MLFQVLLSLRTRDLASVLIHDFRNEGQAQAHALRFRCEERIEYAFHVFWVDTATVIRDSDLNLSPASRALTSTVCPGRLA